MLGNNLILEGDLNFIAKAAATYNYPPNLYELFRTNGYQKWHDQHHIMGSKSLTQRVRWYTSAGFPVVRVKGI